MGGCKVVYRTNVAVLCFVSALALIGAVACLPKLLWEELQNIEQHRTPAMPINCYSVVTGTQPVRVRRNSTAVRFTQVVQTQNKNFILAHTVHLTSIKQSLTYLCIFGWEETLFHVDNPFSMKQTANMELANQAQPSMTSLNIFHNSPAVEWLDPHLTWQTSTELFYPSFNKNYVYNMAQKKSKHLILLFRICTYCN